MAAVGSCHCLGAVGRCRQARGQEGVPVGAGFVPQQGYMAMRTQELANADFTESDRDTDEDQFAHATAKTCASCGEPITARQPARRRGETDWVHDVCPGAPAPLFGLRPRPVVATGNLTPRPKFRWFPG